jgi:thiol-disulfide isomerase/thioredoxin
MRLGLRWRPMSRPQSGPRPWRTAAECRKLPYSGPARLKDRAYAKCKSLHPFSRIRMRPFLVLSSADAVAKKEPRLHVGDVPPPKLTWQVNLADYKDKVVIVTFWASWCPPCRKEMSVLAKIQKAATRDKVVIFAVNWKESDDQFRAIRRALKDVDLTLLSDSTGWVGDKYDVDAIPHMDIIGRDGKIAAIHVGYGEDEIPVLVNEINALWSGDAPSRNEQTSGQ